MSTIKFSDGIGKLSITIPESALWFEESRESYRIILQVSNMICGDRLSNIIIDIDNDFIEYLVIRFSSCDDNLIIRSNKILPEGTIIKMDVSRDYEER